MNAEETAMRLQETAAKCLSSLNAWNKDLNNRDAREALLDSVHELRKVTSRLEIDIALNDRKATNAKPMPVPEHKSKIEKKTQKPLSEILPIAEIKESKKRKKIEIETANEARVETNAEDDTKNEADKTESKPRRPRRKKREENPE